MLIKELKKVSTITYDVGKAFQVVQSCFVRLNNVDRFEIRLTDVYCKVDYHADYSEFEYIFEIRYEEQEKTC